MDHLVKSYAELEEEYWAAHAVMVDATAEYNRIAELIGEKKRLDALKLKLGAVSASDLELLKESLTLGAESIVSEESTIQ